MDGARYNILVDVRLRGWWGTGSAIMATTQLLAIDRSTADGVMTDGQVTRHVGQIVNDELSLKPHPFDRLNMILQPPSKQVGILGRHHVMFN